jgi:hypothetical protein
VWLFVTLTLVATLLHLDKFHVNDPDAIARVAAWIWIGVYAIEPPLVLAAVVLQLRAPGDDRPRERPLPVWYRAGVGAQAVGLLLVGLLLFVAPSAATWWPWTLTPLVAQAMASWLLGLSVVLAVAVWENDWDRVSIATSAYVALGALELTAAARYAGDFHGGIAAVVYISFLVLAIATGGVGVAVGGAGRRRRSVDAGLSLRPS